MKKSVLQYLGMAFVAATVMSMQIGRAQTTVEPPVGQASRPSPNTAGNTSATGNATAERVARPDRRSHEGPVQSTDREVLERGSLRVRVARGVVQA